MEVITDRQPIIIRVIKRIWKMKKSTIVSRAVNGGFYGMISMTEKTSHLISVRFIREEEYRCNGIAGHLLDMAVEDLRAKGRQRLSDYRHMQLL